MKQNFSLNASMRIDCGKGASRRLRHLNKVPGIVYGANKSPTSITVEHRELQQLLANKAAYTQILELKFIEENNIEKVVLRDLQRHPFKAKILHFDLQRIDETQEITVKVPFRFVGEEICPGIKIHGGIVSHLLSDIEVRCFPKYLLEFIEVDLSKLEVNQTIHLSDLTISKDIEILALSHGENKPIATIYVPKSVVEDTTSTSAKEVPVINKKDEDKSQDKTNK